MGSAIFNEMLTLAQRLTYIRMFLVCGELWNKEICIADLPNLQLRVLEAICFTELHLPATEADAKMHMLLHLAFDNLTLWGE